MTMLRLLAASKINPGDIGITNPVRNADTALAGVLNTAYMGAGILCVLVIIIAGYFYATSMGNPSQTKRAKDAILNAVIGLVVVMTAFVITQFVIGRF